MITALAVGAYAVWEQDITFNNKEDMKLIELLFPFLYKYTRDVELFTLKKFCMWSYISLLHSLVVFGFPFLAYNNMIVGDGKDLDCWDTSMLGFFLCVHLHYALLALFIYNWSAWAFFCMALSYSMFFPIF